MTSARQAATDDQSSRASLRGIDTYAGHITSVCDDDHLSEFRDRRVAVIGPGIRLVETVPLLVREAQTVKVFPLAAVWVLPEANHDSSRDGLHATPHAGPGCLGQSTLLRFKPRRRPTRPERATAHLHRQIPDPWMRRQLTPDDESPAPFAESDSYYPALRRANCELVTWPIATLSEVGVRTVDGLEHHVDVILLACVRLRRGGPAWK